jgi:hypothetical protein
VHAFSLWAGGGITAELPNGNDFIAGWWSPAYGNGGQFQNEWRLRDWRQTLIPSAPGDRAALMGTENELSGVRRMQIPTACWRRS